MTVPPALRFDGQVAIVTGAGRGIGRAHALSLAERGARVVVNDLGTDVFGRGTDLGPAESVVTEIVNAGGVAVADGSDVADERGAASLVARAVEELGRVDVVVNNAGILEPGTIEELGRTDLQRHLDVHVLGAYEVTRAAWPHLVRQRYGRVVVSTSIGVLGAASLVAYTVAKGATVSLGRSLALAGVDHGIRVNLLAPTADTRMVDDAALRARAGLPPIEPADRGQDLSRDGAAASPMLVVLAHASCPVNGEILTAGGGRVSRLFVAETLGIVAPHLSAEEVLDRWGEIVAEPGYTVPVSSADAIRLRELARAEAASGGLGVSDSVARARDPL